MLGWNPHTAPGVGSTFTAAFRKVFSGAMLDHYLAGGKSILGSIARDPGNGTVTVLRPGVLLGKNSSGYYGTSVLGLTGEAMDANETTLTVSEAVGDEIVRRLGAAATFKLTGPPTAGGTVRTLTVTYSAVAAASGGNRDVTITAMGVSEVQTLTFGAAATGGTLRLIVPKPDGTLSVTAAITWDTTDATYLSNINTALDTATGTTAGIVASGATPDTTLIFTFDRTQYFGPQPQIQVHTFPTSTTSALWADTTAGVDGRFVTASMIQPTDGCETILTFVPDGAGIRVVDIDGSTSIYAQNHRLPVSGEVAFAQLLPAVADASLKTYVRSALNAVGQFVFDVNF